MGIFAAAHGCWEGGGGEGAAKRPPLTKNCHTYPKMMKLDAVIPDLKKIQKIYESHACLFSSADISIFSPGWPNHLE